MKVPLCSVCSKPMKMFVDSVTGEVTKYIWETTCEHGKGMRLMRA